MSHSSGQLTRYCCPNSFKWCSLTHHNPIAVAVGVAQDTIRGHALPLLNMSPSGHPDHNSDLARFDHLLCNAGTPAAKCAMAILNSTSTAWMTRFAMPRSWVPSSSTGSRSKWHELVLPLHVHLDHAAMSGFYQDVLRRTPPASTGAHTRATLISRCLPAYPIDIDDC